MNISQCFRYISIIRKCNYVFCTPFTFFLNPCDSALFLSCSFSFSAWNLIQTELNCCGVSKASDWFQQSSLYPKLPASCCAYLPAFGPNKDECHIGKQYFFRFMVIVIRQCCQVFTCNIFAYVLQIMPICNDFKTRFHPTYLVKLATLYIVKYPFLIID